MHLSREGPISCASRGGVDDWLTNQALSCHLGIRAMGRAVVVVECCSGAVIPSVVAGQMVPGHPLPGQGPTTSTPPVDTRPIGLTEPGSPARSPADRVAGPAIDLGIDRPGDPAPLRIVPPWSLVCDFLIDNLPGRRLILLNCG
jgi:hypothetical protein